MLCNDIYPKTFQHTVVVVEIMSKLIVFTFLFVTISDNYYIQTEGLRISIFRMFPQFLEELFGTGTFRPIDAVTKYSGVLHFFMSNIYKQLFS